MNPINSLLWQEAKKALALKSEISKTDKDIDRMVYKLYGLKEEEIGIVEGCNLLCRVVRLNTRKK